MKRSTRIAWTLGLGSLALTSMAEAQTVRTLRWAAIGDITTNWTARAALRLTADSVISFRVDAGTVLRSGDSSFWASGRLADVFAYQPDIVSIQLGSADSKAVNWDDSAKFVADYKALIDTLASMPSKPRILVVYPTPIMPDTAPLDPTDPNVRNNRVISKSIVPRLRAIALDKGADTVNLYTPLATQIDRYLTPGGNPNRMVPNSVGQDTLGRLVFEAFVHQSIRIMCVGNSITQAAGTTGGVTAKDAYAVRLNLMLGARYWVWNGGRSGWWMQRAQLPGASSNFKSYVTDKAMMDTLFNFKPHFITIKLGTNDARQNFWNTQRFITDYRYMIDTLYNNINPKPGIILLKAFPAWRINGNWAFANSGQTAAANGINGDIIRDSLGPAIDVIAASRTTQVKKVVDLHTPFVSTTPTLAPDGVHPNKAGQDSVARVLYREILSTVAIRVQTPGKYKAPAQPSLRAVRSVKTTSGKAAPAERGMKTIDGKSIRGTVAPGVLVKPAVRPTSGQKKQETK